MPKKPHPADIEALKRIDAALQFVVHFRRGPHDISRTTFNDLPAARRLARFLAEAHASYGRKAAIYAITADGKAEFVPPGYMPRRPITKKD